MLIRTLLTCLALLMLTLPAQRALADIPPTSDSTPPTTDSTAPKKDGSGSPPTSNDDGGCAMGASFSASGRVGGAVGALTLIALGFALTRRSDRRGQHDRS